MTPPFKRFGELIIRCFSFPLIKLILPFIVLVCFLNINLPIEISRFFVSHNIFLILTVFILIYLSLQLDKSKMVVSFIVIIIISSLPLSFFWNSATTNQAIVGGLIPHRDGMYYYLNARNVLNGGLFDSRVPGRPLFPSFLVTLLAMTESNIQVTQVILLVLCSFTCWLLLKESQAMFGSLCAAFLFTGLFMFYKRVIPYFATEQFGILFGTLSLATFLKGIREDSKKSLFLSILLFALSQIARPGVLFILPALAVWSGFIIHKKRFSLNAFFIALIMIMAGFLLNIFIQELLSSPESPGFSSFAYTLYGQSVGGAGWTQIQKDYPGLADEKVIFQFAIDNIKRYPLGLLIAAFKSYRDFFTPGIVGGFVFLIGYGSSLSIWLPWLMIMTLFLASIIISIRKPLEPINLFLILSSIAFILSIPFAPPIDSGKMRTYASTIPLIMLFPTYSLHEILKKLKLHDKNRTINKTSKGIDFSHIFSALILFVLILSPLLIKLNAKPHKYLDMKCSNEEIPISFSLSKGSYITIIPDGSQKCGKVPDICLSLFLKNGMHGYQELYDTIVVEIKDTKEPIIFTAVNDLNSGKYFHLLMRKRMVDSLISQEDIISACVMTIDKQEMLFFVNSLQKASLLVE